MTLHEVVKKLIGEISPIGETQTDEIRFENLEKMTNLVHALVLDIDEVCYKNKNRQEYSVRKSAEFAEKFLRNDLGID